MNDESKKTVASQPQEDKESVSSSADPLQVFDFTEAEETVVNSLLEHGAQSVSKLSRTTDLPRTTVYSVLKRLEERGLGRRKTKGYASIWGFESPIKLKKRVVKGLEHLDRELTVEQLEKELGIKVTESSDFFMVQGADAMLQIYQWMAINHFNQRMCMFQPQLRERSVTDEGGKTLQLSAILKDNKIKLEKMSVNKTYRMSDIAIAPGSEVLIGRHSATLANWDEETLILIKNPALVTVLWNLFDLLSKQPNTSSPQPQAA